MTCEGPPVQSFQSLHNCTALEMALAISLSPDIMLLHPIMDELFITNAAAYCCPFEGLEDVIGEYDPTVVDKCLEIQ